MKTLGSRIKSSVIEVVDVAKTFSMGSNNLSALGGVSLKIQAGEFVAIAGASGSGKTTLLNLIGCLDRPTSGRIFIEGQDVSTLESDAVADLRARKIGFVFQTFNLLPVLTALENVEYPLELGDLAHFPRSEKVRLAKLALTRVGLESHFKHRPSEMSGGQRQRVAIARALVKGPRLILADEPTANLDSKTAREIIELMRNLSREEGVTLLFTSHDPVIHSCADRVIHMSDGLIIDETIRKSA